MLLFRANCDGSSPMTATALLKLRSRVKHLLTVRPSFLHPPLRNLNSVERLFYRVHSPDGNHPAACCG